MKEKENTFVCLHGRGAHRPSPVWRIGGKSVKLYRIIDRLPLPDVVEMVNLQKVTNAQVARLNRAENKQSIQNYFFWIGLACYHYGVMAGKRAERARRKGRAK